MAITDRDEPPKRIGLVGYGSIALGHLEGVRRLRKLEVSIVVDTCEERRHAAADTLPEAIVLDHIDQLDPADVDILAICTPPSSHIDGVLYGLNAGLPVLCEKPLVLEVGELDILDSAVARSRGEFHPSHNYLHAPSVQALRKFARNQGEVAGPLFGHFRTLRTSHARGVPEWRPDWRRERSISGGGIVQDHGPHSFYIANSCVGHLPSKLRCDTRYSNRSTFSDTEDYAFIQVSYPDDSFITIELDWNAPSRQTSYLLFGEWGHARVIDDRLDWAVNGRAGAETISSNFNDPSHTQWFASVWSAFMAECPDPEANARLMVEAATTVRMIDACYRSAANDGVWVDLSGPR